MTKNYHIAAVPGDGIGHEIVPAGSRVLEAAASASGFGMHFDHFDYGAGYYKKHGVFMPADGLATLKDYDAILFGAVGLPDVDDTLPAKDYTFRVRTHFEQYVNYRPVRNWKGVQRPLRSKQPFDFVVVRENTEGEFVQVGSQVKPDSADGMGIDTSIFTRKGIERIAHYAFRLARTRRKHVTTVTKSNTLINSLTYWDRVIGEVAGQYLDVEHRYMYIDATSANFVLKPWIFDVVLTSNLFGDILSDLGGALMGSLGLGGSGNINPEKEYPSMFEPIHGSAPDIAGKGISNPVGMFWSVALMLEHLGESEAANAIMEATDKTLAAGYLPVDIGGSTGTEALADKVIQHL
ncbi:MAG: isocitrate/isopropylmalate family dehydrogenase [Bacteroidales bacterium]|nr:isocitrate/isopropylmalate family dehydrogenase [Bacteroidales bacterium]MDT8431973.1 isocitrate/isopropylmalate family dehydrogenase [Bacteroidales bacterium]